MLIKIFAVTDTHGDYSALKNAVTKAEKENADIFIHAGDFTIFGKGLDEAIEIFRDVKIPVLIVPGNH